MSAIIFFINGVLVICPLSISMDRCRQGADEISKQYNIEVICIETVANPNIQKIYPEMNK